MMEACRPINLYYHASGSGTAGGGAMACSGQTGERLASSHLAARPVSQWENRRPVLVAIQRSALGHTTADWWRYPVQLQQAPRFAEALTYYKYSMYWGGAALRSGFCSGHARTIALLRGCVTGQAVPVERCPGVAQQTLLLLLRAAASFSSFGCPLLARTPLAAPNSPESHHLAQRPSRWLCPLRKSSIALGP
ncbi:hypothetical protein BDZ91DRAFT_760474 [Kalaharituber pfeilii]|nr:hypothetical protein BDZ91DRAFT_760474 [Kalaharituber pfeilii]